MTWITEGLQTSPSTGTLLADTGEVPESNTEFTIVLTSTAVATVLLQRRNAANNGTLQEQIIKTLVNETQALQFGPIHCEEGERVRLVTSGLILGSVQGSITYV